MKIQLNSSLPQLSALGLLLPFLIVDLYSEAYNLGAF